MQPTSLERDISPPAKRGCISRRQETKAIDRTVQQNHVTEPGYEKSTAAAIEAGKIVIDNHLEYFLDRFKDIARPGKTRVPRLSLFDFRNLYERNQHDHGRHFVVHQHDHPVSGVHYDLRLQFSKTSCISFAIPYGLPGNPNSVRPNRMAIETRVHNLWNNLIESASHATGSLLIWDTGEYEVLPYRAEDVEPHTDNEISDVEQPSRAHQESEKLFSSFQKSRIRLRLHGARLPAGYTISLRLTRDNRHIHNLKQDVKQSPSASRKRRRRSRSVQIEDSSDAETGIEDESNWTASDRVDEENVKNTAAIASDDDEDAIIRANNAYTGASNTIGSIHQRHWFLSLDKENSGFRKLPGDTAWTGQSKPFFVLGRDDEISVITGRSADEVLEDEGVAKFIGRKKWRPIVV